MEETLVFIDEGFLGKLTKHFGRGNYIKFNKLILAKNLSKKQGLLFKHLFYYTAPPFQGTPPKKEEIERKSGYDTFIKALSKNKDITIREGRVQKLFDKNKNPIFKQKGVDTLMTIDLSHVKEDYLNVKKIIIITSDTDFSPIINDLEKRGIKVILYTYFDKKRGDRFSVSNELLNCCSSYFQLTKKDFEDALLKSDK